MTGHLQISVHNQRMQSAPTGSIRYSIELTVIRECPCAMCVNTLRALQGPGLDELRPGLFLFAGDSVQGLWSERETLFCNGQDEGLFRESAQGDHV